MIGIDTNVLLRFLMQDDPVQLPVATRWMAGLTEDKPGFISLVVLAETIWVMSRKLNIPTSEIADAVDAMLLADELVLQNANEVYYAVEAVRAGTGSFADMLIAELGIWSSCDSVYTFDRKASRRNVFQQL